MEAQANELFVEPRRELARRVSGGIEVALYWSPLDDSTTVEVWDAVFDETIVFDVPPERSHSSPRRSTSSPRSPTRDRSGLLVAGRPPPIPARRGQISPGSAGRRPATIAT